MQTGKQTYEPGMKVRTWLVTGAAGFIGSHLVEDLLRQGQRVRALDNYATGKRENLDDVTARLPASSASRFSIIEGDIRDPAVCREACCGVDVVLHQAALGSVPRSVADPATTNEVNISGFLNMLLAARQNQVSRFVYAASSSTYGDHPGLPKREDAIGKPLSPYAVTKYVNELYADVFQRQYGLACIGLRYFNVFGPRQDPYGPYAAVIPRWMDAMIEGQPVEVFGDGSTSRDFSYVRNVVQANLLAANTSKTAALGQVYNIACGERTTLLGLFEAIRQGLKRRGLAYDHQPRHRDFREGDVRHSLASIDKARTLLDYQPTHDFKAGMEETIAWALARRHA